MRTSLALALMVLVAPPAAQAVTFIDAWTAARAKVALLADPHVAGNDVHAIAVEADGSRVRLAGDVANEEARLAAEDAARSEPLHARLPYTCGQVLWAVRHEMARTLEDILARRTRSLLLDARASIAAAPRVAELMATELHRDRAWMRAQIDEYTALARGYLP